MRRAEVARGFGSWGFTVILGLNEVVLQQSLIASSCRKWAVEMWESVPSTCAPKKLVSLVLLLNVISLVWFPSGFLALVPS